MNAGLSVGMIQLHSRWTDLDEIWYGQPRHKHVHMNIVYYILSVQLTLAVPTDTAYRASRGAAPCHKRVGVGAVNSPSM